MFLIFCRAQIEYSDISILQFSQFFFSFRVTFWKAKPGSVIPTTANQRQNAEVELAEEAHELQERNPVCQFSKIANNIV